MLVGPRAVAAVALLIFTSIQIPHSATARDVKPKTVTADAHREIKSAVIALAQELGVTFCAYIFLHAIGRSQDQVDLIEYGANTVLGRFNEFLTEKNEHGIAKLDRMGKNGFIYAKEKFQRGLTFSGRDRRLGRIISVGFTCDGASHLSPMADIVLGSFRYCVNEPEKDKAKSNAAQINAPDVDRHERRQAVCARAQRSMLPVIKKSTIGSWTACRVPWVGWLNLPPCRLIFQPCCVKPHLYPVSSNPAAHRGPPGRRPVPAGSTKSSTMAFG